jgi:hypothetical protein
MTTTYRLVTNIRQCNVKLPAALRQCEARDRLIPQLERGESIISLYAKGQAHDDEPTPPAASSAYAA